MNATTTRTGATPKQEALIRKIAAELGRDAEAILADAYSPATASRAIESLIADSKAARIAVRAAAPAPQLVDPGYFLAGDAVIRVQASKDNPTRRYAKALEGTKWVYRPGLIFQVTEADRISLEAAAAHGHRTGQCMICGRTLTVKASIDRGVGPVCWGRLGG